MSHARATYGKDLSKAAQLQLQTSWLAEPIAQQLLVSTSGDAIWLCPTEQEGP
jgi:hypothetical protein